VVARSPRRARSSRHPLLAIAVAVAILGALGLIALSTSTASAPSAGADESVAQAARTIGRADAAVTIEEWADFQCPACGMFARATEPRLVSTYIADGRVQLVFHHMAFLGSESGWAAEAAECAGEQGRFWDYHDQLFAAQRGENKGAFSRDNLKRIGADLGLGPAFASCVDSKRYAQGVRDETQNGKDRGVVATPTLFVNGRKIEGALTYDQVRAIIDPLLAGR
jgi:protein-disulfide isomerase